MLPMRSQFRSDSMLRYLLYLTVSGVLRMVSSRRLSRGVSSQYQEALLPVIGGGGQEEQEEEEGKEGERTRRERQRWAACYGRRRRNNRRTFLSTTEAASRSDPPPPPLTLPLLLVLIRVGVGWCVSAAHRVTILSVMRLCVRLLLW